MSKIKIGVIGHTGRLGKPLVEILKNHPYAEIDFTHSNSEPNKKGLAASKAELFFLALPYGESEEYTKILEGKRLIDLSIDHRFHEGWVYGLSELNKDKINEAEKVANPGCYATAILEALFPIKDLVSNIRIKAYSGVSGRPNQEVVEDKGIERYAQEREHPQVAEIEKYLGKQIEYFEPHLVYPLKTGIVAVIDAQLKDKSKIMLENSDFIRLVDFQAEEIDVPYLKKTLSGLADSNFCNISFDVNGNSIKIISALDNLIKGGAGQAVQNFNLMYGFDERTGLIP